MDIQHQHLESLYPKNSRFQEIEEILNHVKRGESCQAIAMPGVGRGNLLKFLAYNKAIRTKHLGEKQNNYHFVFINFDEIKHRPVMDALKFIFLELTSSLHERRWEEEFNTTNAIFKDSLSYHDELVLTQGLKEAVDFLAAEKQLHIVFLFERFENYLPQLTSDFFAYLRSLRNKAKYKFSVVFSTTRPLEETVEPTILADFFEFFAGNEIYLTLTDDPGIRFRIEYLEKLTGQTVGKQAIEKLLQLTAGHGKLTRLSVEAILGKETTHPLPPPEEGTKGWVSENFLLSQKTIQAALKELWEFLSPSEQQYIIQTDSVHHERNEFLEKIGLVKNNKTTIPLFASYLKQQKTQLVKHEEPVTYDVTTNTIKKGSLVISDKLTSSEFRLLHFLITNPGKIVDREEIINAVWKDTASTLGVTDQALDQLIFRLRKKIEENPNNPKYIQTVKGRGIQFTQ